MNMQLIDIGKNKKFGLNVLILNNYHGDDSIIKDDILSIKDVFRLRQVSKDISTSLNSECRKIFEKIETSLHKLDMAFYNTPLLSRLMMWSSEGQTIVDEAKRCIASLHGYKFTPKGISGYEEDINSKIESMNSSLSELSTELCDKIKTFFKEWLQEVAYFAMAVAEMVIVGFLGLVAEVFIFLAFAFVWAMFKNLQGILAILA